MKIGVTYKLYKVRITNSEGKIIQLLLGKESYDYLLQLKHFNPGYHSVSLVQPEQCICERVDSDTLADLFNNDIWL